MSNSHLSASPQRFLTIFELKCFVAVWCILTLTYLTYIVSFYLGNHDFQFIRHEIPISSGLWEGRFTQFAPLWLLTHAQILPVFNTILGFGFLSAGTIVLSKWYKMPPKPSVIIPFATLIVLNPYILTQLYYVHTVISICLWHALTICALILIDSGVRKQRFGLIIAGSTAFFISLGGYASVLELAIIALAGKLLLDVISLNKFNTSFFLHYLKIAAALLVSLIAYAVIIAYIKENNMVKSFMYNVQSLPAAEIIAKFFHNAHQPFNILLSPFPFCRDYIIWCPVGLFALALFAAYQHRRFFPTFIILIAAIEAMFTCAFLSPYNFFNTYRIHSFSVPYLSAILYAVITRFGKTAARNLSAVLIIMLICCYIKADFNIQKIWLLGNEQDEKLADRIRADFIPHLTPNKHYRLTTIGDIGSRSKFTQITSFRNIAEIYRELFTFPYYANVFFSGGFFLYEAQTPIWGDGWSLGAKTLYSLYKQGITHKDIINAELFAKSPGNDIESQISTLRLMQPWPKQNYYFIGQKDIYLMLNRNDTLRTTLINNLRNNKK